MGASAARAAAPNPTSLAPGVKMTVVKHGPSNYIFEYGAHIHIEEDVLPHLKKERGRYKKREGGSVVA